VCFVGIDRTYPPENEAVIEDERQKFLQQRCSVTAPLCKTSTYCRDSLSVSETPVQFVPRSAAEKPRNAVTVDDSSKQLIRTTVLMELLTRATDLVTLDNKTWNRGGRFISHFYKYAALEMCVQ